MPDQLRLSDYKQQIADLFNRRSPTYDQSEWHLQIAHRLVEYAQLRPGDQVLDIATGTAMAAIAAAQVVGAGGKVIGIDISSGMLAQAQQKVTELGLTNIEFQLADAESLNFPANSFDCILCSSALIWLENFTGALHHWHQFLKPGGLLGFHAFAETAFIASIVVQKVLAKYGIALYLNQPTGTTEKCRHLLEAAGYDCIEIISEQYGSYVNLEQAKGMWLGSSYPAPGQFPNPFSQLSTQEVEQVKAEFELELAALETAQGIWNDITTFFTFGRKPVIQ
ncbi:class I SAM-dependent methyltransferase [Nostoc sp. FACHB-280]|uniref:class I SAM-dependent methyltransferase n=1 Tax=Nostoc sp. FACHB-280 TaxID=2692839 RepID=UPI00168B9064|nr:methyltransferase domain-containing protein [Nostoc sp. FACHB-280]MBD2492801.1 methyltransferase domain-containing protein [Nostoc sp. FACHB-280]